MTHVSKCFEKDVRDLRLKRIRIRFQLCGIYAKLSWSPVTSPRSLYMYMYLPDLFWRIV